MNDDKCAVYKGGGGVIELLDPECPFCNATGEENKAAKPYFDSHICQGILLARKAVSIWKSISSWHSKQAENFS